LSRVWATAVIAVTAILVFVLILVLAVPALIEQIQGLIVAVPEYINQMLTFLGGRYPEIFGESSQLMRHLSDVETMMREGGMTVLNQVLAGSLKLIDFLVLMVVTPVVAFYLLLDWDRMLAKINAILPIRAEILALTPMAAFRPRRWRGALLPKSAEVTFEVMEAEKRPVSAVADSTEVRGPVRIAIASATDVAHRLLFDPGHGLEERLIREQFV
jgi:hypothetical protein